ncbi:MAG: hypothetical protein KA232_11005 [Chryseobacterium sp.]|nr:hypothetical protein [Chryseobacterium sp.]
MNGALFLFCCLDLGLEAEKKKAGVEGGKAAQINHSTKNNITGNPAMLH